MDSRRIINVRGPSGSGKTTTILNLLDNHCSDIKLNYIPNRRNPITISCMISDKSVTILGYYNKKRQYGGCDTISDINMIFDLIESSDSDIIIAEGGFLLNREKTRIKTIPNCTILYIDEPKEVTFEGYKIRTLSKTNYDPLGIMEDKSEVEKPKSFDSDHASIRNIALTLKDEMDVQFVTRPTVLPTLLGIIDE
jgi:uridine kinase